MKKLNVIFYRDLKTMRQMLSNSEYRVFLVKSKIFIQTLKDNFKAKDYTNFSKPERDGFILCIEKETQAEIEEQKEQMDRLMFDSKPPQNIQDLSKERFFRMMKRKWKQFNIDIFLKATKKTSVLGLLNMCGIMVKWEIEKQPVEGIKPLANIPQ